MIKIGQLVSDQLFLPIKPPVNYMYILSVDGILYGYLTLDSLRISLLSAQNMSNVYVKVGLFNCCLVNIKNKQEPIWLFDISNGVERVIDGWLLENGTTYKSALELYTKMAASLPPPKPVKLPPKKSVESLLKEAKNNSELIMR